MKLKFTFYLLKAFLPSREHEIITGDLEEEYLLLCSKVGKHRALFGLYIEVIKLVWFVFPRTLVSDIALLISVRKKVTLDEDLLALHVEGNIVNKVNLDEVNEIEKVVEQLFHDAYSRGDERIKANDVGIISPFRLQANAIYNRLHVRWPEFEKRNSIGTISEFQGCEKRIIIISTYVCSSDNDSVQFIDNPQFINVLVTRAKEKLILIGNLDVLRGHGNMICGLINYIHARESAGSSK
jgi:hypothetical protein